MNTNKETARNLMDVRIILAVLWVAGMLSSLNGDTYRLSAATGPLGANPELLSVMAILFVGHIFMCALTLTLKSPVSRWANRIIGIFYGLFILAFWIRIPDLFRASYRDQTHLYILVLESCFLHQTTCFSCAPAYFGRSCHLYQRQRLPRLLHELW